jgi:nucleoside-diphosphate-sugar epimerase
MRKPSVLICGAAGNLGSRVAGRLLDGGYPVRLMIHRRPLPAALASSAAERIEADLARAETLGPAVQGIHTIVYFAGILFRPQPERFLPETNVAFVRRLAAAARAAGVERFVLISFPHVEGNTTPEDPARGRMDGQPDSVHARTRLEAERTLLEIEASGGPRAVILRSGTVYGRGLILVEAAYALFRLGLMAVWRRPTWYHLISITDLLAAVERAVAAPGARGVYLLGDDRPWLLQDLLDTLADRWGFRRPRRLPEWMFFAAAATVEAFSRITGSPSPIHRDLMRIGMVSHVCDTGRMRAELLARLTHPTLDDGWGLMESS